MPYRLTNAQRLTLDNFRTQLQQDRNSIANQFEVLKVELYTLPQRLNAMIKLHNERLALAAAFAKQVAEDFRDNYDEKSERWQGSEAGQAALSFVEEWEEVRIEPVEPVQILFPDAPQFDESLNVPELMLMTDSQLERLRELTREPALPLMSNRALMAAALAALLYWNRLRLCPDHRDKATGACIVCEGERRERREAFETARQMLARTADDLRTDAALTTSEGQAALLNRIADRLSGLDPAWKTVNTNNLALRLVAMLKLEPEDAYRIRIELDRFERAALGAIPSHDILPWLQQAIRDFEARSYRPTAHYLLIFKGAALEMDRLRAVERFADTVNRGKSPCGHWSAYAVTQDGGKLISCLQCRAEEAEAKLAAIRAPGEDRLQLGS